MKAIVWQLGFLVGLWCFSSIPLYAQNRPGVALEPVKTSDIIEEFSLNGTVNALRTSNLSTAVAGLVTAVRVETGDRVAAGDALITLDDEQAGFQLASARASSAEARARVAEARRRLQEARSVGAGRNIAATEVDARESEVEQAEAVFARLSAEEKRLQVELDRHRIEAPYAGVVSHRAMDLGEWATPGDVLLTLVDTTNLRLDFQVPQRTYRRITDDTDLLIVTEDAKQPLLPASIESVVPVNDPRSRTFLLRAGTPEKLILLPGMAVQAKLRVSSGEQGLTVSRDAINRYPEGRVTVWIAEAAGDELYQVREKRVEIGSGFDNRVEVLSGLDGNEQVVVRGNESLQEGAKVRKAQRSAN